jgi:hypothetical protein
LVPLHSEVLSCPVFVVGRGGLRDFASRAVTPCKKRCADKPLCIQHCGAFYLALLIGLVVAFFFFIPRSPLLFATLHQRRALVKIA